MAMPSADAGLGTPDSTRERVRVLTLATAGFTLFFAVWVMFAIVGIPLREELGLSDGEFALLAMFPFTRLVHIVTYPLSYLWRPYQVVIWNRRAAR